MEDVSPSCFSSPDPSVARHKRSSSQQRKNTIRACDTCREKKTRCSGTLPCVRCCRLSIPCEYLSPYSRGLAPPLPPPLNAPDDFPTASGSSGPHPSTQRDPRRLASLESDGLVRLETHGDEPRSPSALSFQSRVREQPSKNSMAPDPWTFSDIAAPNLALPDASSVFQYGDKPYSKYYVSDVELPSFERAMHLVAVYFDFAVITYRFLHRGRLEQWVRQLFESVVSPRTFLKGPHLTTAGVVFSVFAIGELYEQPDSAIQLDHDEKSERWLAKAKYLLSLEAGPPRLETIQARVNICLYLLASSRASESWFSFGLTMQLVIAMGLHRASLVSGGPVGGSSYMDQQLRRRLFWTVYTLDRYISVIFGRPSLLHEDDVDQEFPDEVGDDDILIDDPALRSGQPDQRMVAAVLHFRLAQILGTISRQLYGAKPRGSGTLVERTVLLMLKLERWRESVQVSDEPWRSSHILQLAYFHAVIHATRPLLLLSVDDLALSPASSQAVRLYVGKNTEAAEEIMTIVDNLSCKRRLLPSFWFMHYTCFCAIAVAYVYTVRYHQDSPLIRKSTKQQDDMSHLRYLFSLAETCQQHLTHATLHSSPSRRYALILEELRLEVHRQIVSHLRPSQRRTTPDYSQNTGPQDLSYAPITASSSVSQLTPFPGLRSPWMRPLDSVTWRANAAADSGVSLDALEGSAWWAQVDSWAYSKLWKEPFNENYC